MISKKMAQEINAQINREFFSAFLYLAMANDAIDKGFLGTGKWMSIQFKEEQEHALKFAKYLQDQGAKVELAAMEALNTLAIAEKDYATQSMLRWFIDEQVEEEANCNEAIGALSMVGGSAGSLYMVDRHIGKRGES